VAGNLFRLYGFKQTSLSTCPPLDAHRRRLLAHSVCHLGSVVRLETRERPITIGHHTNSPGRADQNRHIRERMTGYCRGLCCFENLGCVIHEPVHNSHIARLHTFMNYNRPMRFFAALLPCAIACAAVNVDRHIDDLARRILNLSSRESVSCRAHSLLETAVSLHRARPELSADFRDAGFRLLRDHTEITPTLALVTNVMALSPGTAESLLSPSSDKAALYSALAQYWTSHSRPDRALEFDRKGLDAHLPGMTGVDAMLLALSKDDPKLAVDFLVTLASFLPYADSIPRCTVNVLSGLTAAARTNPLPLRAALTQILKLAKPPAFGVNNPEIITIQFRDVTTSNTRDSILFPL
jgi:hypothetical protein